MNITDNQVVMATHGRGIITVTIPELPEPPVVTLAPSIEPNGFDIFNNLFQIKANLRSPYDSTQLWVNNALYSTLEFNTEAIENIFSFTVTDFETIDFQLKSYKNDKQYLSGVFTETVFPLLEASKAYLNAFDVADKDFVNDGFSIKSVSGFTSKALHSPHPYSDNRNYISLLRVPIIVQEGDAEITFNEIAIIEPGDPGTVWPNANFWDFVIVEGSKNGKTWLPIEKGYDCQADAAWLEAYNSGLTVSEELYRKRTLNIKDKFFYAGDTILIRFRLYADAAANGWGWAIDSLTIQKEAVGINNNYLGIAKAYLAQNYPNPFTAGTTIEYNITEPGFVSLKVFDLDGRLVKTLVNKTQPSGNYKTVLDGSDLKTGTYLYQLETVGFVHTKKLILIK
jgi:hypothetical protein